MWGTPSLHRHTRHDCVCLVGTTQAVSVALPKSIAAHGGQYAASAHGVGDDVRGSPVNGLRTRSNRRPPKKSTNLVPAAQAGTFGRGYDGGHGKSVGNEAESVDSGAGGRLRVPIHADAQRKRQGTQEAKAATTKRRVDTSSRPAGVIGRVFGVPAVSISPL